MDVADFMVSDGTNFSEFVPSKADGIVDYNNPNNVIKLGWSGNSFTAADFTYALGLNNDKKIKDVSKSEYKKWLGLDAVNNTADASKSVDYANSAGSSSTSTTAAHLGRSGDVNAPMNFYWDGSKGTQPTWLWGGEDGTNMYVYNPANFKVNKSNEAYKSWTTTHPDSWYLESNWDGSYFQVRAHNTGNDTLPVNVRKSDYSDYCNNERSVVISSTRPTDDKCKIWVKI